MGIVIGLAALAGVGMAMISNSSYINYKRVSDVNQRQGILTGDPPTERGFTYCKGIEIKESCKIYSKGWDECEYWCLGFQVKENLGLF